MKNKYSKVFYHCIIAKIDREKTNALVVKFLELFSPEDADFEVHREYLLQFIECLVIVIAEKIDISTQELFTRALENEVAPIWRSVFAQYSNRLSTYDRIGITPTRVMIKAHEIMMRKENLQFYIETMAMLKLESDIAPYKLEIYKPPLVLSNSYPDGPPLPFLTWFASGSLSIDN